MGELGTWTNPTDSWHVLTAAVTLVLAGAAAIGSTIGLGCIAVDVWRRR